METEVAAPAARGYFIRFCSRLKEQIRYWDFLLGLIPAILIYLVHDELYGSTSWKSWAIASLIAYTASFVLYLGTKSVHLLIRRDKQLELTESGLVQLRDEIAAIKNKHLDELLDDGYFWANLYSQHAKESIWQSGSSRWTQYVCKKLRRYYGLSVLEEFTNMDGVDQRNDGELDFRMLNKHLENLRAIKKPGGITSASGAYSGITEVIETFGTVDFDPGYNYKTERHKKRS